MTQPKRLVPALAIGLACSALPTLGHTDPPRIQFDPGARLVNLTRTQAVFHAEEDLVFYALRANAGACTKLEVDIDGVSHERHNVTFPLTLVVGRHDKGYPKTGGEHTITLRGRSPDCLGQIQTTFHTHHAEATAGQGKITSLRINDYPAGGLGKVLIEGSGRCRLKVMILGSPAWTQQSANAPVYSHVYDDPVQLPFLATGLRPLPAGEYVAWVVVADPNDQGKPDAEALKKHPHYKGCLGQDPQAGHRGVELKFRVGVGTLYASHPLAYSDATKGHVADFRVTGFRSATARGQLEVRGGGRCRFRADILDLNKPNSAQHPVFSRLFDPPVALPITLDDLGPLPDGSYRAYLMDYDKDKCPIQGPDPKAGGWYVDFKVGAGGAPKPGSPNAPSSPSSPGAPTAPGGGGAPGGKAPATGQIASMVVPGGSFAEDEAQKIQVSGKGGCGFDLMISNKSYGGSYEQTFPVGPLSLDGGPTLYNGTHFGTLAEGSYHATATGKNGCTGSAAIDFKVTAKTSTKKIAGKPTVTFDQKPKSGDAFSASKDSNIWFKVTVPQAIKDEPYATCCEVEYDFMNQYGGWEALPGSPFSDTSFGLAVKQDAGVVPKSVSGFTQGTMWRVKVRGYKYKTEFEWSDWLEFKVDMH